MKVEIMFVLVIILGFITIVGIAVYDTHSRNMRYERLLDRECK